VAHNVFDKARLLPRPRRASRRWCGCWRRSGGG